MKCTVYTLCNDSMAIAMSMDRHAPPNAVTMDAHVTNPASNTLLILYAFLDCDCSDMSGFDDCDGVEVRKRRSIPYKPNRRIEEILDVGDFGR